MFAVFEFLDYVYKLVIHWMRIFPQRFLPVYEHTKKYKLLYLTDLDAAISKCGTDIIDLLSKTLGGCARCNK